MNTLYHIFVKDYAVSMMPEIFAGCIREYKVFGKYCPMGRLKNLSGVKVGIL